MGYVQIETWSEDFDVSWARDVSYTGQFKNTTGSPNNLQLRNEVRTYTYTPTPSANYPDGYVRVSDVSIPIPTPPNYYPGVLAGFQARFAGNKYYTHTTPVETNTEHSGVPDYNWGFQAKNYWVDFGAVWDEYDPVHDTEYWSHVSGTERTDVTVTASSSYYLWGSGWTRYTLPDTLRYPTPMESAWSDTFEMKGLYDYTPPYIPDDSNPVAGYKGLDAWYEAHRGAGTADIAVAFKPFDRLVEGPVNSFLVAYDWTDFECTFTDTTRLEGRLYIRWWFSDERPPQPPDDIRDKVHADTYRGNTVVAWHRNMANGTKDIWIAVHRGVTKDVGNGKQAWTQYRFTTVSGDTEWAAGFLVNGHYVLTTYDGSDRYVYINYRLGDEEGWSGANAVTGGESRFWHSTLGRTLRQTCKARSADVE